MRKLATILLAAFVALPAAASTIPIDETHTIQPDGTVSLEIIFGEVTVRGGSGDAVPGDWGGLHLYNSSDTNDIRLESVQIRYGGAENHPCLRLLVLV